MFKNSLLIGQNLSYKIGQNNLFSSLNISLNKEKTGLVGRNGIGKTTLLRILTGELQPTNGVVHRNGKICYLPQDSVVYSKQSISSLLDVDQKLKAIEKINSGTYDSENYEILDDDWDIAERTKTLLEKLGLDPLDLSRKVESLSGGETTRVVLASLLLQKPVFLILDEPTNNLDSQSRSALHEVIGSFKGGCLIVSHDRALLSIMDNIIELSTLGLKTYGGNYKEYLIQKQTEEEAKERQLSDAQKLLRKTKKETQKNKEKHQQKIKKGGKDRLSRSHSKMLYDARKEKSQKTKSKLINKIDKQLEDAKNKLHEAKNKIENLKNLTFELVATKVHKSKIIIEVKNLTFGYLDCKPIINNFNLTLIGPKRIAISGPNGSGKTTLLKLLTNKLQPTSGSIKIGVDRLAYLDQKVEILNPHQTVLENFKKMNPQISETYCRLRLASFLFAHDAALNLVANLSSGERLRAALACILMAEKPPQLIILDEPTNHMDLYSIASIENALENYKGALIVVSHDETFLKNIAVEEKIA